MISGLRYSLELPILYFLRTPKLTCWAAEYKFPEPIPEFADAETEKFRTHLLDRLSKKVLEMKWKKLSIFARRSSTISFIPSMAIQELSWLILPWKWLIP